MHRQIGSKVQSYLFDVDAVRTLAPHRNNGTGGKAERQLAPSNRLPTAKPLLSHSHWVPLYEVLPYKVLDTMLFDGCQCSICISRASVAECLSNMVVVAVRPCCGVQKYIKLQLVHYFRAI
jgi:hypothetical protein